MDDPDLPPGIRLPSSASYTAPYDAAATAATAVATTAAAAYAATTTAAATAAASCALAPSRCWPETDTEATFGDGRGDAWICLAWARGACPLGSRCAALHRLPSLKEEQVRISLEALRGTCQAHTLRAHGTAPMVGRNSSQTHSFSPACINRMHKKAHDFLPPMHQRHDQRSSSSPPAPRPAASRLQRGGSRVRRFRPPSPITGPHKQKTSLHSSHLCTPIYFCTPISVHPFVYTHLCTPMFQLPFPARCRTLNSRPPHPPTHTHTHTRDSFSFLTMISDGDVLMMISELAFLHRPPQRPPPAPR